MILFSQWYEPNDEMRAREIAAARLANAKVFSRSAYLDGTSKKVTFNELFAAANSQPKGTLCVIANTDIAFGETAQYLGRVCKPNRLVSLTRWNTFSSPDMTGHIVADPERAISRFFAGTQDAWAFLSGTLPDISFEIPTGAVGCDQLLLGWAVKSGCEVTCPSLDIRTFHIHQKRNNWSDADSLRGFYAYPELTSIDSGDGIVVSHDVPWESDENGLVISKVMRTIRNA